MMRRHLWLAEGSPHCRSGQWCRLAGAIRSSGCLEPIGQERRDMGSNFHRPLDVGMPPRWRRVALWLAEERRSATRVGSETGSPGSSRPGRGSCRPRDRPLCGPPRSVLFSEALIAGYAEQRVRGRGNAPVVPWRQRLAWTGTARPRLAEAEQCFSTETSPQQLAVVDADPKRPSDASGHGPCAACCANVCASKPVQLDSSSAHGRNRWTRFECSNIRPAVSGAVQNNSSACWGLAMPCHERSRNGLPIRQRLRSPAGSGEDKQLCSLLRNSMSPPDRCPAPSGDASLDGFEAGSPCLCSVACDATVQAAALSNRSLVDWL